MKKIHIIIAFSIAVLLICGGFAGVIISNNIENEHIRNEIKESAETTSRLIDGKIIDHSNQEKEIINETVDKAIVDIDKELKLIRKEVDTVKKAKEDKDCSDADVISVTDAEYELMCKVVQCEAGVWVPDWKCKYSKKEYEKSQMAVANCILNMSEYYGYSLEKTMKSTSRFNVWPGAVGRCSKIYKMTKESVNKVLSGDKKYRDHDVTCFRSKYYHKGKWAKDLYHYAGTYFSAMTDWLKKRDAKEKK